MTPDEREFLCNLVKKRSGLVVSSEKDYLLESRLMPIARRNGLGSLGELIRMMQGASSEALRAEVTEAMTTNESFFFRDKTPFAHFTDTMMPELLERRAEQRKLRIWCAAASTGQEPYSLAICLREMANKINGWRIEIIGTDLSGEVLEKAKAGLYSQFEVQRGLPIQMLVNYFTQVGDMWQIDSSIRGMIQYKKLNLLEDFRTLGNFDIIFCRNVLIYFDKETKSDVLNRMSKQVAPDGFLVLGAAETLIGITDAFTPSREKRGLYTLEGGASAAVNGGSTASPAAAATTAAASAVASAGASAGASGGGSAGGSAGGTAPRLRSFSFATGASGR